MADPVTIFLTTYGIAKKYVPVKTISVAPKLTYVDPVFNRLLTENDYYRWVYGHAGDVYRQYTLGMSMIVAPLSYDNAKAADSLLRAMVAYWLLKTGIYPYNPASFDYGGLGYSYQDVFNVLEGKSTDSMITSNVDAILEGKTETPAATTADGGGGAASTASKKSGFPWGRMLIGGAIGTIGGPAGIALGAVIGAATKPKE